MKLNECQLQKQKSGIVFTCVLLTVGFAWQNGYFHFIVVAVGCGGILFVVFLQCLGWGEELAVLY